jgi:hypothetical protein
MAPRGRGKVQWGRVVQFLTRICRVSTEKCKPGTPTQVRPPRRCSPLRADATWLIPRSGWYARGPMRRTLKGIFPFLTLLACEPDALAPAGGLCHSLVDCVQDLVCIDARCTSDVGAIAGGPPRTSSPASADGGEAASGTAADLPAQAALDGGQGQVTTAPGAPAGMVSDAGPRGTDAGQRRDAGSTTPAGDASTGTVEAGAPVDGGGALADAGSAEIDAEAADASLDASAGNAAMDGG